ncbi:hypothetical protein GQ42DRAFT_78424 [Ramicandelaber brevisporus]|nr:hypothetical protein GQ42DRAFT_78424 [Ramicandelaber brevisporus]
MACHGLGMSWPCHVNPSSSAPLHKLQFAEAANNTPTCILAYHCNFSLFVFFLSTSATMTPAVVVVELVAPYLELRDVLVLSSVCRAWHAAAMQALMRRLTEEHAEKLSHLTSDLLQRFGGFVRVVKDPLPTATALSVFEHCPELYAVTLELKHDEAADAHKVSTALVESSAAKSGALTRLNLHVRLSQSDTASLEKSDLVPALQQLASLTRLLRIKVDILGTEGVESVLGAIENVVSNMRELEHVDVSASNVSIPAQLARTVLNSCPSLHTLNLGGHVEDFDAPAIKTTPTDATWPRVRLLSLVSCLMAGTSNDNMIPLTKKHFPALTSLQVQCFGHGDKGDSSCSLYHGFASQAGDFAFGLKQLNLDSCAFVDNKVVQALPASFPQLESLNIANLFTVDAGALLQMLQHSPSLVELVANNVGTETNGSDKGEGVQAKSRTAAADWACANTLRYLVLEQVPLAESDLVHILQLPNLRAIDVSRYSSEDPDAIGHAIEQVTSTVSAAHTSARPLSKLRAIGLNGYTVKRSTVNMLASASPHLRALYSYYIEEDEAENEEHDGGGDGGDEDIVSASSRAVVTSPPNRFTVFAENFDLPAVKLM